MEFFDLITERYSVRSFTKESVSDQAINKILYAAKVAPTGCNNQPQRILVINDNESLSRLKECTKCHFDAPCAMLICYNKGECWHRKYDGAPSGPIDATIVATHMTLAAHDIGIGCCMVMHFDPTAIKKSFNIPSDIEPILLLVMGHPTSDSKPLGLHSSFRDQSQIVFYNKF